MKPCSASWRRWYDVAPVLSESSRAKVVAVAGPSTRRRISIFIRVGCDSARSPAADGVMDGVRSAMTANISLQTSLCKHSLGELWDSPRQFGCRSGRIHSQIVGDYPDGRVPHRTGGYGGAWRLTRRTSLGGRPSNGTWTTSPTGSRPRRG